MNRRTIDNEGLDNFDEMFPDCRGKEKDVLRESQLVMLRILKIVDYICRKNDIKYCLHGGTLLGAIRHEGFIPWDDDIDIAMMREDMERFIKVAKIELPKDMFLQTNETDTEYDMPWIKVRDRKSKIEEYKPGNYHRGMFIDIFPLDEYINDKEKVLRYKNKYKRIHRLYTLVKEPFETIKSPKLLIKNVIKLMVKILCFPITFMSKEKVFKKLKLKRYKIAKEITSSNSNLVGDGVDVMYWTGFYNKNDIFPLVEVKFEDSKFLAPNNYDNFLKATFGDYMKLPPEDQRIPHNLGLKPILTEDEIKELNKGFEVK